MLDWSSLLLALQVLDDAGDGLPVLLCLLQFVLQVADFGFEVGDVGLGLLDGLPFSPLLVRAPAGLVDEAVLLALEVVLLRLGLLQVRRARFDSSSF